VGATRSIGLFGIVELVEHARRVSRWRRSNGSSPEMQALGKFFRAKDFILFVRWNTSSRTRRCASLKLSCASVRDYSDRGLESNRSGSFLAADFADERGSEWERVHRPLREAVLTSFDKLSRAQVCA